MYNNLISQDYLMHHGVKGMKWGVRRYQDYNKNYKGRKDGGKAFLKNQYNRQIKTAKKEARRHGVVGTLGSAFGKSFIQTLVVNVAATPLYLLSGPAAPVVAVGANTVSAALTANNWSEAVVRLSHR